MHSVGHKEESVKGIKGTGDTVLRSMLQQEYISYIYTIMNLSLLDCAFFLII